MTKANEKWVLFKQFMHNELGITKEDIREWVKEAVKEEAERLVKNTYDNYSPKAMVEKALFAHDLFHGDHFKREVILEAAKLIVSEIEIVPKERKTVK
jgi:predicted transcriptional regulator